MKNNVWIKFYLSFFIMSLAFAIMPTLGSIISNVFVALSFINAVLIIKKVVQRLKLKAHLIESKSELVLILVCSILTISGMYNNYLGSGFIENYMFNSGSAFAHAWDQMFGFVIAITLVSFASLIAWSEFNKLIILLEPKKEDKKDINIFFIDESINEDVVFNAESMVKISDYEFLQTQKEATCPPLNF